MLMRRLKHRKLDIVEAPGGMVSRFVGDEVLALFGISTAHKIDRIGRFGLRRNFREDPGHPQWSKHDEQFRAI